MFKTPDPVTDSHDKRIAVTTAIRRQIVDGVLKPGERLPSFEELAERFAVGSGTVRRAVASLEEEGVLVCRHGSGTYVASFRAGRYWNRFQRYQRRDGSIIEKTESRLLHFEQMPAPEVVALKLGIAPGTTVIHAYREITFDRNGVGLDEIFLPRSRFCNLSAAHLRERGSERSLYTLYEDTDGILITSSSDVVYAECLTPHNAGLLGLQSGIPMLVLERISYDAAGASVEYRFEKVRAEDCRIRL